ncbi:MAG: HEAT repeat-containing protein 1 [Watsoniomyces obsoletus]|nr:MAG: HEAT repeat-containing protein 1 [Watsoniomyces obsoletus]
MPTSLALQLSQIASGSTHSLNLKAQRKAHSQSLIFDPDVAAGQDFNTIYVLCLEGYQELCLLDQRFGRFKNTLFSEESKNRERTQMTESENGLLDRVLEDFLGLVGGRLLLRPAIKAVEWLIRRFRVHEYNTTFLLLTFLPYHTAPIFPVLLSILPHQIPPALRFLHPYRQANTSPPRHAIVYSLATHHPFNAALNSYVLRVTKAQQHHHALLAFWSANLAEATTATLDIARSGRKAVQAQNEQDVLIRLLPVLNEGLAAKQVPELRIGCYMILVVLATKAELNDTVVLEIMKAVVAGWTEDTASDGLVCLALLMERRPSVSLPKPMIKTLTSLTGLSSTLQAISQRYRVKRLILALLSSLTKQIAASGATKNLHLVEELLLLPVLGRARSVSALKAIMVAAQELKDGTDEDGGTRARLGDLLLRLSDSATLGPAVVEALQCPGVDIDLLEMKLQTVLPRRQLPAAVQPEDQEMLDVEPGPDSQTAFENALSKLPSRTVDEVSFLSAKPSHLFGQLINVFLLAVPSSTRAQEFSNLPVLRRDSAMNDPLLFTFFIRTWCGPYPAVVRSVALQIATATLSSQQEQPADLQALLPYFVHALADSSKAVRQSAANLVLACSKAYEGINRRKGSKQGSIWAQDDFYGNQKESRAVDWLNVDQARKVISEVFVPGLEECILDGKHVEGLALSALKSSKAGQNGTDERCKILKTADREALFSFFASHASKTPLLAVRSSLLRMLNQVSKVGKTKRTTLLLPLLRDWASEDTAELRKTCTSQRVKFEDLEAEMVRAVEPRTDEGMTALQSIASGELGRRRPNLYAAVFSYFRTSWSTLKEEARLSLARFLLQLSLSSVQADSAKGGSPADARECLRALQLSPDILTALVDDTLAAAHMEPGSTPVKRRKLDHGRLAPLSQPDPKPASDIIEQMTLVLELVDTSKPEFHQPLLKRLFHALERLQELKLELGSELAYLESLVLGSLLSIARQYKASLYILLLSYRLHISSTSRQVQNEALLLVAALAEIAPESVLHSIMPIFTFVGPSLLRQDDDFSIHVIDEAINRVVPPLVDSFRKRNQDPVVGTADLLWSFTAAFQHVPTHRRLQLFTSLLRTLGESEFLFVLLVMLADKYGGKEGAEKFAVELAGQFEASTQFNAVTKYLDVLANALRPKSNKPRLLICLDGSDGRDASEATVHLLSVLAKLLSSMRLKSQLANNSGSGIGQDGKQSTVAGILEKILDLLDTVKNREKGKLFGIMEAKPALTIIPTYQFIPRVATLLKEASDAHVQHAAIACLDTIIEKYGKSTADVVVAAAEVIGSEGLGSGGGRIKVAALFCLRTAVEVLGAATVPVVATALPKALGLLETSMHSESESPQVCSAIFAFLSAIVATVPWMVTPQYLDTILKLVHRSTRGALAPVAQEDSMYALRLIAVHVPAKDCFAAIQRALPEAIAAGPLAVTQHLELLRLSIEKHPNSVIVKHSQLLVDILLGVYDLRRVQASNTSNSSFTVEEVGAIEGQARDCTIKMIMKMNDAAFRPLFVKLLEWADIGLPKKDRRGRVLRLTAIYGLIEEFFNTLKSFVTSYSSLPLENVVDVLKNVKLEDHDHQMLWATVLRALRHSFANDQDNFWQSPSRLSAIQDLLLAQIGQAHGVPGGDDVVVPTITELAVAVDSIDHRKDINAGIMKQLRAENARVRLTAIRCEEALTGRLGEDWLALLPEMLPFISELQEDDDEQVEHETEKWIVQIEGILGESLDAMLR